MFPVSRLLLFKMMGKRLCQLLFQLLLGFCNLFFKGLELVQQFIRIMGLGLGCVGIFFIQIVNGPENPIRRCLFILGFLTERLGLFF